MPKQKGEASERGFIQPATFLIKNTLQVIAVLAVVTWGLKSYRKVLKFARQCWKVHSKYIRLNIIIRVIVPLYIHIRLLMHVSLSYTIYYDIHHIHTLTYAYLHIYYTYTSASPLLTRSLCYTCVRMYMWYIHVCVAIEYTNYYNIHIPW